MDPIRDDFRPLRFSTTVLPERERLAACRDFLGPELFRMEIEPSTREPFHAEIMVRSLPGVTLSSNVTSPARFTRLKSLLTEDNDGFDLFANSTGGFARQAGRELTVRGGVAYVLDAAEPAVFESLPAARTPCLHVRVARADLLPLVAGPSDSILRPIPPDAEVLRYLLNYVRVALTDRALTNAALAAAAANHLRDLFALVIGATRDAAELAERRGLRMARLHSIKRFVAENLADPRLSVDQVAARHRISPRSVQRMLEDEGTTFTEFVLDQRLDAVYRALTDAHDRNRTIVQIALDAGFGDLSYFNRRFRRRYGAPPSWFRGGG